MIAHFFLNHHLDIGLTVTTRQTMPDNSLSSPDGACRFHLSSTIRHLCSAGSSADGLDCGWIEINAPNSSILILLAEDEGVPTTKRPTIQPTAELTS